MIAAMDIKSRIKALGLTNKTVCEQADLSLPMLSQVINGNRRLSPEKAVKLAAVLGVAPSALRPDLAIFMRDESAA